MDIVNLRLPILLATIIVSGLLAFTVIKNNPRNATNVIFAALSVVTGLWLIDIYLSVTPAFVENSLLWVRLSIFFAAAQIILFYLLARTLPHSTMQISKKTLFYLILTTLTVMVITISPFAFTEVNISADNQVEAVPGPGLAAFVLFAISFSLGAIYTLLKRSQSAIGRLREQYRYVLFGLAMMLGLLITTVLIPVALFKYSGFVPLAPLYTIIFLGFTTTAIVRHRLFDIRTVIARSVAYLLVVTTFVVAYSAAALVLYYVIFTDGQINTRQHLSYIALALLFSPTIYWLKRIFDKVTNRIFFRDAYDAQGFLNQLNKALVSTIDTEQLLYRSAKLIGDTIKSEFCIFTIKPINDQPERIIGNTTHILSAEEIHYLRQHRLHELTGIIVADELPDKYTQFRDFLQKHNIGIIAQLAGASQRSGGYGYLILGIKKSGNPYSHKDIRTIEIVTDELTIAIQNALRFEEIKNFNVTLKHEVANATKELRITNQRLRVLDQTKDDFISMASHQLRTPLTSVKGYVSMVLDGDGGKVNDTQRKLLTQSFLSAQRMVYLISDLLNVSRLRTGRFVIEPVLCDLDKLIEEEVEQLVETVKSRGLELTYHRPSHFPTLMVDETKLRQVIMNFIDNAIYYTPNGGHIDVYLVDRPDSIEFTVVDDGIGVPKQDQHHLFSKFYRAKNARRVRPDGTGLGIFMAKKVIIAQGGAVIFKSAEGKGSTFGFTFPKAKLLPSAKADAAPPNQTAADK